MFKSEGSLFKEIWPTQQFIIPNEPVLTRSAVFRWTVLLLITFQGAADPLELHPPPPAPYLWLSHRWLSSPEQILNVLVISGFFIIMSIALQICILHFSWTRQPFVPNVISRGWRRCTLTAPCAVWFISCSFLHGRRREGGQWGARYFKHKHYTRPINVHWY